MSKYKVGDRAKWSIGGKEFIDVTIMSINPTNYHKGFDYEVLADDGGLNLEGTAEAFGILDYQNYEAANESELIGIDD